MTFFDYQIGKAELLSMMVFTVGCTVDHVTTYYGLTFPTIEELNPMVLLMIGSGFWNIIEISLISMGIGSGLVIAGSKSKIMIMFSMTALFLVGIIRLSVGFHNIILIYNIVDLIKLSSTVV